MRIKIFIFCALAGVMLFAVDSYAVNPDDYIDSGWMSFAAPKKKPDHKPGEIWTEWSTGMQFVWIPEGCFMMGSPQSEKGRDDDEGPVREVCVGGFWMGRYEVTNYQFKRFNARHDSRTYSGQSFKGDSQPAVYVSWDDAKQYADWMSKKGKARFRLPTEAEWEYAARAGTTTSRYWGTSDSSACTYANVLDKTAMKVFRFKSDSFPCNDGYAATSPVGRFRPNSFGLYDMLGNVAEWCEDRYDKKAYSKLPKNNPVNLQSSGTARVVRGGTWDYPRGVRSAARLERSVDNHSSMYGFRLVRIPD